MDKSDIAAEITANAMSQLGINRVQVDFEHGQWWVTCLDTGAQWSVNETTAPRAFDFEQVTEGIDD